MKSLLLLAVSFCFLMAHGQLTITPNPANINSGTITITYGAQGDYSLLDPMGNPNLLLYTGLETDGVVATWDYHDDFSNTATFVPFNFDNAANAYVAQINVAARMYQEEPSLNVVNLPQGLQVNDFYFLIITTDLSRQSADLRGSTYGWQPATLSTIEISKNDFEVVIVGNELSISVRGDYVVTTYDLSGRLVNKARLNANETSLELGFLKSNQLYITTVSNGNATVSVKHLSD